MLLYQICKRYLTLNYFLCYLFGRIDRLSMDFSQLIIIVPEVRLLLCIKTYKNSYFIFRD